jgi:hypothetical protein
MGGEREEGRDLRAYLAVGGAIGLDDPPRLVAERLEHLVVVAVLGQPVPAVRAQASEDLGRDRAAAALPALVVLSLPPRGRPASPAAAGSPRHERPSAPALHAQTKEGVSCVGGWEGQWRGVACV